MTIMHKVKFEQEGNGAGKNANGVYLAIDEKTFANKIKRHGIFI